MINPNELRLTNCVKSTLHEGLETEIFSILSSKKIRLGANPLAIYNAEDIEPIALTEEWLLRFGFYESKKEKHYLHEHLDVEIEKQGNVFAVVISDYEHGVSHFILHSKFVHTFQNNIFALTGEELTLKNE